MDTLKAKSKHNLKWTNVWEMANLSTNATGLPTGIHLYQGKENRHTPRIKVQMHAGLPNRRNTVSVSIHDPSIVKGRSDLLKKFENSYHHGLVREFIERNREYLLKHANAEIFDDELNDNLKKVKT